MTPNVSVINPGSVARSKSLHFILTIVVEELDLDIILNSGQGEGKGILAATGLLEYDPRSRVRAAGSMMDSLTSFLIGLELV